MITGIYVNGVKLNNDNVFLSDIGNIGSASVEFSQYVRGGISGQVLSNPLKRGMAINMEFEVFANSYSTFFTQRDRLIRLLQNKNVVSDYLKTLSFELQDGTTKAVDVLFTQVVTGVSPKNILHQTITVTAISEKEYFQSGLSSQEYLYLQDLGGMAIPMDIPLDISNNPIETSVTINNAGNAQGFPVVVVYGEFASGFSILNETLGERLDYTDGVGAGEYLTIDMYNRTIIDDNGASQLANFDGEWVSLTNGNNVIKLIGAGGNIGYGIITYNDYYLNI